MRKTPNEEYLDMCREYDAKWEANKHRYPKPNPQHAENTPTIHFVTGDQVNPVAE